jgi:glycosyltransferase involved in cell wall biosynthesis
MIRAVTSVLRGEGLTSAIRRAGERVEEALRYGAMRFRTATSHAEVLNFSAMSVAPRIGGVAIQLQSRLRVERRFRNVALLHPGGLEVGRQLRRVTGIREALAITGAKAIHIEGTFGLDIEEILGLQIPIILSVHDLSLLDAKLGRKLLASAAAVVFPSDYLRDVYRTEGIVIEPGIDAAPVNLDGPRNGIAFAGSVRRDKGAHLLPDVQHLHIFGGGDADLFRALRRNPNIVIHGYCRAGTLPSLLARHRIGLVILPSIVPESYSLTLSEAWLAGAAVAAFDHGAIAERIRRNGGGWLAPLESGASGLADIVNRREPVSIPHTIATSADAAKAYLALYRRILDS